MIGARERLFGLAGELGDGEIGFEFGCSFVRGAAEMPTSFGVASCIRVSISTKLQSCALESSCEELHKLCVQPLRSSGVNRPRAVFD